MKDLLLLMADLLPFDEQIKMMKEAITNYEADPTDENKKHIEFHCLMLSAKQAVDQVGSVEELLKKTKIMEQGAELLSPKNG